MTVCTPGPHPPSSNGTHDSSFRQLIEGVLDYAVYMLDPAGNVASWNSGAERFKVTSSWIIIDGGAGTPITRWDGRRESIDWVGYDVTSLPYHHPLLDAKFKIDPHDGCSRQGGRCKT